MKDYKNKTPKTKGSFKNVWNSGLLYLYFDYETGNAIIRMPRFNDTGCGSLKGYPQYLPKEENKRRLLKPFCRTFFQVQACNK